MTNDVEFLWLPATWEQVLRAIADQHSTTIQALSERLLLRPAATRNIVLALERRGLISRAEGLYDPNGHHERLVIFTTRLGRRWLRRHPARRQLSLAA
jgi:DNA-binding MarR family transcriptional regulator